MDYNLDNYPSIRTHESNADFIKRVNDWGIGFRKSLIERLEIALNNQNSAIERKNKGCDSLDSEIAFQSGRMWVHRGILGRYAPPLPNKKKDEK